METKSCIFLGKTGEKGFKRKRTPWNILSTFWLVQTHKWLLSIWNELATIKPKQKETPKPFHIMFQYILLCLRSQQIYSTLPLACGLHKYVIANQLFQWFTILQREWWSFWISFNKLSLSIQAGKVWSHAPFTHTNQKEVIKIDLQKNANQIVMPYLYVQLKSTQLFTP